MCTGQRAFGIEVEAKDQKGSPQVFLHENFIAKPHGTWYHASAMSPLPNVTIEFIPDEVSGFTAVLPGVEVVGQGETKKEAMADLVVCLQGYIAQYGIADVLSRIIAPSQIRQINLGELVHG